MCVCVVLCCVVLCCVVLCCVCVCVCVVLCCVVLCCVCVCVCVEGDVGVCGVDVGVCVGVGGWVNVVCGE